MFSLGETSDSRDSLIFHYAFWEAHQEVLKQADRIIICTDDEPEGWSIFWRLNRYYKFRGQIDLHSNRKAPGVSYFGTNEEIYTPNQIMRTELNRAAIMINEIFCRSVAYPTLRWEELDDFHRESKIAAADHILMKIRVLLEDETITELTAATEILRGQNIGIHAGYAPQTGSYAVAAVLHLLQLELRACAG